MSVIVTHSTEGATDAGALAAFRANNSAPHDLVNVKTRTVTHLTEYHLPARSLRNLAGGVQTNLRGGVIQVELTGFASRYSLEKAGALKTATVIPELYGDDLNWLAHYLRWVCAVTGTPYAFPRPFFPYPDSYGTKGGFRLTPQEWLTVEGIIGHQHVPENVHGDPGALNAAHLLKVGLDIPVMEGPDMTPDEFKILQVEHDGTSSNLINVLGWLIEGVNKLNAKVDALPGAVDAVIEDEAITTAVAGVSANGGNVPRDGSFPAAVADELAKRLAD